MTTAKELEQLISSIAAEYRSLDTACQAVIEVGAMDIEGPLHTAIWKAFDSMLRHIDHNGWIAWFVFDNHCGKKGLEAVVNGKLIKVTTPARLAGVILADKRTPE